MKLYFVRHGKTQWNLEGRFQGGNADSPLLNESMEQLMQLGHYLADIKFDHIFSSDLPRAKQTAQIINQESHFPTNITYTEELREWNLGNLEGQKITTITSIYPKQMDAFRHNLAKFDSSIFDADSVYQTTHRVSDFVMNLKNKPYKRVLLVGHGACFTASIRALLGYEPAQLRLKGGLANASVTVLETKDFKNFDLLTWNDTSYQK